MFLYYYIYKLDRGPISTDPQRRSCHQLPFITILGQLHKRDNHSKNKMQTKWQ